MRAPARPLKYPLAQSGSDADFAAIMCELPRAHECYSRQFLEFVLSRPVDPVERGAGVLLREKSRSSGSPRDLLAAIVTLNAFRARTPDAP